MKSVLPAPSQTVSPVPVRTIVDSFDREFVRIDLSARSLVNAIPFEIFYKSPDNTVPNSNSVGELVLRGAGVVEQTCGGLTANLWDDPFEWTLPETLSTSALVGEYLDEVEQTRRRAFARFVNDRDLEKLIATPAGDAQPLVGLLLDTLLRAASYQARAAVILSLLVRVNPPGV